MSFEVINGDCLEVMPRLAERGSVFDACITDPPYGTTACAWDSVIPFTPMWANLKALVKRNGAIVLFGSQPFTSALVMSNPQMFKHQWVWDKKLAGNFLNMNIQPAKVHEDIAVFADGTPTYNPQMVKGPMKVKGSTYSKPETVGAIVRRITVNDVYFPKSILEVSNGNRTASGGERLHPTQKPVELMRYLVRTYTNPGDTVLDFTMGSGSTGVACVIEGRNFVGIEQNENYCRVAEARMKRASGEWAEIPKQLRSDKPLPLFGT